MFSHSYVSDCVLHGFSSSFWQHRSCLLVSMRAAVYHLAQKVATGGNLACIDRLVRHMRLRLQVVERDRVGRAKPAVAGLAPSVCTVFIASALLSARKMHPRTRRSVHLSKLLAMRTRFAIDNDVDPTLSQPTDALTAMSSRESET